jgi:hypothetical protein
LYTQSTPTLKIPPPQKKILYLPITPTLNIKPYHHVPLNQLIFNIKFITLHQL